MPEKVVSYEITEAINKAVSSAIDSIRLLQKLHEQKIHGQIAEYRSMLKDEKDAILAEIRNAVKLQMDGAVQQLEAKFRDYERQQGDGIFPQVPPLSHQQMEDLKRANFTSVQVVYILGEIMKRIPGTEDMIVPPEYLRHLMAKTAGIIV